MHIGTEKGHLPLQKLAKKFLQDSELIWVGGGQDTGIQNLIWIFFRFFLDVFKFLTFSIWLLPFRVGGCLGQSTIFLQQVLCYGKLIVQLINTQTRPPHLDILIPSYYRHKSNEDSVRVQCLVDSSSAVHCLSLEKEPTNTAPLSKGKLLSFPFWSSYICMSYTTADILKPTGKASVKVLERVKSQCHLKWTHFHVEFDQI